MKSVIKIRVLTLTRKVNISEVLFIVVDAVDNTGPSCWNPSEIYVSVQGYLVTMSIF